MFLYIRKKVLLISILFLFPFFLRAEEIKICLWEGENPEKVLKNFENKYRGSIYLEKHHGNWLIINKIDIEEYLYGVVGKEMDTYWPFEALKAQSVCSRTLAIYKKLENEKTMLPYDIKASVYHQVYGRCEEEKIIKAVEETRGEIITYEDKIVQIFFHACCGGKTASASETWGGENMEWAEPLEDKYCHISPYFGWKRIYSQKKLEKILGIGDIKEIKIEERDSSGRVKKLKILLKNGKMIYFTGHSFRMKINYKIGKLAFLNPLVIPGTNFSLQRIGKDIIFTGNGYGHGVGMCQWGAREMAEKGFNYKQILSHFFPLLKITKHK